MKYFFLTSVVLIFFPGNHHPKGPDDLVLKEFSKVENLMMKSTMIKRTN